MTTNENRVDFKNNLNVLIDRAIEYKSLMFLLREEQTVDKEGNLYFDFGEYFNTIYSHLYNLAIIEAYKFFENGKDCISIRELKNNAFRFFSDIFPDGHRENWSFPHSISDRNSIVKEVNELLKEIEPTINKVKSIRNKSGLAHGQKPDYSLVLGFSELEAIQNCVESVLNIFDERCNNRQVAFRESIRKTNSLVALIETYGQKERLS